ncbi:MAG: trypsin-like peptidase domain-containing protein [Planctomycetes bacterium]|nr:trypsin-like peptidase domain-containing protein [Planctomycetota bacterium]
MRDGSGRCAALLLLLAAGCTTSGGSAGRGATGDLQASIYSAWARVEPALVSIYPVSEVFQEGRRREATGVGSGVIFSPEGLVLTNNHVVEGAQRVDCLLADKRRIPARILGTDLATDLAVLQMEWADIPPERRPPWAELGTSSDVKIGDFVLALGTPSGLTRSLTVGVVSSTVRNLSMEVNPFHLWIQTDAAINPGNSGGPLVNLQGKVIGINARKQTQQGVEGLGFAIPIDVARGVAYELIDAGEVRRGWLGVSVWQSLEEIGRAEEVDAHGVLVGSVAPGGGAAQAGVRAGDFVVSIDGREVEARYVEELPAFRDIEAGLNVGFPVEVIVVRGTESLSFPVDVQALGIARGEAMECLRWGFVARELPESDRRLLQVPAEVGVRIDSLVQNGPAASRGLGQGLLLLRVDGEPVGDLRALRAVYDRLEQERKPLFEIVAYHPANRCQVFAAMRPAEGQE